MIKYKGYLKFKESTSIDRIKGVVLWFQNKLNMDLDVSAILDEDLATFEIEGPSSWWIRGRLEEIHERYRLTNYISFEIEEGELFTDENVDKDQWVHLNIHTGSLPLSRIDESEDWRPSDDQSDHVDD